MLTAAGGHTANGSARRIRVTFEVEAPAFPARGRQLGGCNGAFVLSLACSLLLVEDLVCSCFATQHASLTVLALLQICHVQQRRECSVYTKYGAKRCASRYSDKFRQISLLQTNTGSGFHQSALVVSLSLGQSLTQGIAATLADGTLFPPPSDGQMHDDDSDAGQQNCTVCNSCRRRRLDTASRWAGSSSSSSSGGIDAPPSAVASPSQGRLVFYRLPHLLPIHLRLYEYEADTASGVVSPDVSVFLQRLPLQFSFLQAPLREFVSHSLLLETIGEHGSTEHAVFALSSVVIALSDGSSIECQHTATTGSISVRVSVQSHDIVVQASGSDWVQAMLRTLEIRTSAHLRRQRVASCTAMYTSLRVGTLVNALQTARVPEDTADGGVATTTPRTEIAAFDQARRKLIE